MKKLATNLAVIAAICTSALVAQRPSADRPAPDPATMIERRVNFLANLLSLTDAQKSQATSIFTSAQTAAEPLRTSISDAHTSLREAVKANNTATIDQVAANIGNLTGQLTAIASKADAAFYATLTADQKAKWDSMGPRGAGMGPGMGPGGMGPGGMGPGGMGGPRRERR